MNLHPVTLLNQSRQSTGSHLGILLLLLDSELEHLPLEFGRTLPASFGGKEGTESRLLESLLNLIEAFTAEAELAASFRDRIAVDLMSAQHLILDLGAVVGIEEIGLEEGSANGFGMGIERTRSEQGLLFSQRRHAKNIATSPNDCQ
jgi:hypothetical protein